MQNNQISTPMMIAIAVVALIVIIGGGLLYLNHRSTGNLGVTTYGSGSGESAEGVAEFHKVYPGMSYPGSGGNTGYPAGYPGGGSQYPAGYPGNPQYPAGYPGH